MHPGWPPFGADGVSPNSRILGGSIVVRTKTVVTVGLLIAVSVILTRLFGFMVPVGGVMGLRISFGELPIYLSGMLFGPLVGAAAGAMADLIGVAVAGIDFFPGFTLSAALAGFIPGLLLYPHRSNLRLPRLLVTLILTGFLVTLLNTYWIVLLYRAAVVALLPPRLISRAVMIPLHAGILWLLVNRVRVDRL